MCKHWHGILVYEHRAITWRNSCDSVSILKLKEVVEIVVYIFPIDVEKANRFEIDAGKCEEKIKALGLQPRNIDPTYREEARKVKRLRHKLGDKAPANWVQLHHQGRIPPSQIEEVGEDQSIIIVDLELGIKAEDIADDFSFGNGTTIGGVRLKDGRWIPCGFVVFSHEDRKKADAVIDKLKDIFMGRG
jgi:hypothetical protein